MKDTYIYPAIFEKEDYGYTVSFPDLEGCFTEGETLENALSEAKEAMLAYVGDIPDDKLPIASNPADIKTEKHGDFVSLVELDVALYRAHNRGKAVKKTLTIPEWLNDMAVARKINFSAALQEILRMKLGV